jgi:hypothetical protein
MPGPPHLGGDPGCTPGPERGPTVNLDDMPEYFTPDDLEVLGITVEDVSRLDPQPVEYTALDGRPCRRRDDVAELLGGRDR